MSGSREGALSEPPAMLMSAFTYLTGCAWSSIITLPSFGRIRR